MATNAYSGFLDGLRAAERDYLAMQRDERAQQRLDSQMALDALNIDLRRRELDQYNLEAPLRQATMDAQIQSQRAALNQLLAANEMQNIYGTINMTGPDNRPRDDMAIARDIFDAAQLSDNPLVRQQSLDMFRQAGSRDAAQLAMTDPVSAFRRMEEMNIIEPGYNAQINGDSFQIIGPDGRVRSEYPVQDAPMIVRGFATEQADAIGQSLSRRARAQNNQQTNARMLESQRIQQSGMTDRARINAQSSQANAERRAQSDMVSMLFRMSNQNPAGQRAGANDTQDMPVGTDAISAAIERATGRRQAASNAAPATSAPPAGTAEAPPAGASEAPAAAPASAASARPSVLDQLREAESSDEDLNPQSIREALATRSIDGETARRILADPQAQDLGQATLWQLRGVVQDEQNTDYLQNLAPRLTEAAQSFGNTITQAVTNAFSNEGAARSGQDRSVRRMITGQIQADGITADQAREILNRYGLDRLGAPLYQRLRSIAAGGQ